MIGIIVGSCMIIAPLVVMDTVTDISMAMSKAIAMVPLIEMSRTLGDDSFTMVATMVILMLQDKGCRSNWEI